MFFDISPTREYDAFGRRIEKDVNGTLTEFFYDGNQIIAEYDPSDNLIRKYIYGPGIDEPICVIESEAVYYYHFDGLGSVTDITDSQGALIERYEYDIYGRVIIKDAQDNPLTQSSIGNPYYFTARELDTETGLYYYRARYYSPLIGRFLQTDPVGYSAGINLYAYCSNNPVTYTDPMGLCKEKKLLEKLERWLEFNRGVRERLEKAGINPLTLGEKLLNQDIPINIVLDTIALLGDIVSIIPHPSTRIGGYAVSLAASVQGTKITIQQWIQGEATWYDVGVSETTTIIGATPHPLVGMAAAGTQLIYDIARQYIGP